MRYIANLGEANAGAQPTWVEFVDAATWADVAPHPTLSVVQASGRVFFDFDWASAPAGVTSISWVATCNGSTDWGVIEAAPTTTAAGSLGSGNVGVPTLPTGILEPSGRLFSDFLIESVKRRARTPISQATVATWEALSIADEQIRSYIVPLTLSTGEDYLTFNYDQTITAADSTYRPSSRAMKIREVQFLDLAGNEQDVPRVALEELEYRTDGFFFSGNELTLVNPSRWAGYTLRMICYLRPSRLVMAVDSGVVSGINRNTGAVTIYTASSNLTGATTCDLVRGTPPFEVSARDVACSVSGTTITITTPSDIPADWGSAGDLVCLPQQSPAPQIHPDLFPLLAQAVAVQILDGNGDQAAFDRAAAVMGRLERDAKKLLTHRVEGEQVPFGGHSPIWDRVWTFR